MIVQRFFGLPPGSFSPVPPSGCQFFDFFQPRLAVVDIFQVARKALVDCAAALCAKLCNNRLHCSTILTRALREDTATQDIISPEQRLLHAFVRLDFADRMFFRCELSGRHLTTPRGGQAAVYRSLVDRDLAANLYGF